MLDDSKIIAGCKKNKHKYQMTLFDKYSGMLRGVCLRYVNNDFDADDLLQEGFIKILENISKYEDKGSLKAWMKRIMINHALNFVKKQNKQKFSEWKESYSNEFLEEEESFDSKLESKILGANIDPSEILKIIQKLPEGYKMVLNLYAIDGYSHKEIAQELNISVNTSKSQLSRARKKMIEKTESLLKEIKVNYEK